MGCDKSGLHFHSVEGNYDVYRYFKGGRAVFEAVVDRTDPVLEIHVGKVNATWAKVNEIDKSISDYGDLFATGFKARRKKHEDRLSGDSVKRYFDAHTAFGVLANLFVPKPLSAVKIVAAEEKPIIELPPAAPEVEI